MKFFDWFFELEPLSNFVIFKKLFFVKKTFFEISYKNFLRSLI